VEYQTKEHLIAGTIVAFAVIGIALVFLKAAGLI
jgi:hypothetical protein